MQFKLLFRFQTFGLHVLTVRLVLRLTLQVLNGTLFAASTGRIDDRWRAFMQFQIARARQVKGSKHALPSTLPWSLRQLALSRHICPCSESTHLPLLGVPGPQTFADAEAGVNLLDAEARWPVWCVHISLCQSRLGLLLCLPCYCHGMRQLFSPYASSYWYATALVPSSLPIWLLQDCAGAVPPDPRRNRGQRLQQLHPARVRSQMAQAHLAARGLHAGQHAAGGHLNPPLNTSLCLRISFSLTPPSAPCLPAFCCACHIGHLHVLSQCITWEWPSEVCRHGDAVPEGRSSAGVPAG